MDRSLWIDCKKQKRYPMLEENKQVDICIIGAGLTGITLAYYLVKAGKSVTILEKNEICSHTSGNTTAKITSQHGLIYNYLLQSVGKKEAKQYLDSNEQAINNIKQIVQDEKIDCDFEKQDAYIFTQKQDEIQKLKERKQLLKVPKLGKSAYEQCAGFMRIFDGKNPLEVTSVHPESYEVAENLLELIGYKIKDLLDKEKLKEIKTKLSEIKINEVANNLNVGEMTLKDIIDELSKPGRDPREEMPKPILRSDVLKFKDLREGQILTGTVRNVIDFGAFVDVGVKHDGLVHISEMSDKFIKNPSEVVSVGDIVKVKVIAIDMERQKVKLSMKI